MTFAALHSKVVISCTNKINDNPSNGMDPTSEGKMAFVTVGNAGIQYV